MGLTNHFGYHPAASPYGPKPQVSTYYAAPVVFQRPMFSVWRRNRNLRFKRIKHHHQNSHKQTPKALDLTDHYGYHPLQSPYGPGPTVLGSLSQPVTAVTPGVAVSTAQSVVAPVVKSSPVVASPSVQHITAEPYFITPPPNQMTQPAQTVVTNQPIIQSTPVIQAPSVVSTSVSPAPIYKTAVPHTTTPVTIPASATHVPISAPPPFPAALVSTPVISQGCDADEITVHDTPYHPNVQFSTQHHATVLQSEQDVQKEKELTMQESENIQDNDEQIIQNPTVYGKQEPYINISPPKDDIAIMKSQVTVQPVATLATFGNQEIIINAHHNAYKKRFLRRN